jgi:hypothetical protein
LGKGKDRSGLVCYIGILNSEHGCDCNRSCALDHGRVHIEQCFLSQSAEIEHIAIQLPPRAVGAIVGIVGESLGRETASMFGFFPNVLKSRTSAALAVTATLARRTVTTNNVRINFIS